MSPFRKLWASATMSNLSDGLRVVSMPLLVLAGGGGAAEVAFVGAAGYLPFVLMSVVGGAVADRFDRRSVMAFADAARAATAALLVLLAMDDGAVYVPLLALLAFVGGAVDVAYDTAAVAIVPDLVDHAELEQANARIGASQGVGQAIVGPSLGALLFAASAAAPFAVAAALSLGSAVVLTTLPRAAAATPVARESFVASVVEAARWLRGQLVLRTVAAMAGMITIGLAVAQSMLVVFATRDLGLSETGYGLLLTSYGVGGIAAALLGDVVARRFSSTSVLFAVPLTASFVLAVMAHEASVLVTAVSVAILGAAAVLWNATSLALRQRLAPAGMRGRVDGLVTTATVGMYPLGALVGGAVAEVHGARAAMAVGAAFVLLCALVGTPTLRRMLRDQSTTATNLSSQV